MAVSLRNRGCQKIGCGFISHYLVDLDVTVCVRYGIRVVYGHPLGIMFRHCQSIRILVVIDDIIFTSAEFQLLVVT